MRRFESTRAARLRAPAGPWLDAWVAEAFAARLTGLARVAGLPPGRGLLVPRCRSVHTVGMRFPIDVAFLSWPPVRGVCYVVAVREAVAPFRVVAPRGLPRRGAAALEAAAGTLAGIGVRRGARLNVEGVTVTA
ncbi:MAG: DUF192 domain-containing protein [Solirubrobacterales bacterium]